MKLFCFNKKKDTQRRPEMTLNRMEVNQSFKKNYKIMGSAAGLLSQMKNEINYANDGNKNNSYKQWDSIFGAIANASIALTTNYVEYTIQIIIAYFELNKKKTEKTNQK